MKTKKVVLLLPATVVFTGFLCALFAGAMSFFLTPSAAIAQATLPMYYTFNEAGTLLRADSASQSSSPYWWIKYGNRMEIENGIGETPHGAADVFLMLSRASAANVTAQVYVDRAEDNLSNVANRHPYNGESLFARYQNDDNYYYGGIRADGAAVIKKKTNGVYHTLAIKNNVFAGTYSTSNPDLIPTGKWIGLRLVVSDTAAGTPQLSFYTDIGKTGTWKLQESVLDDPAKFGAPITNAGSVGIQSDYADAHFDNFLITGADAIAETLQPTTATVMLAAPAPAPSASYDSVVLSDKPVMYLAMNSASSGKEKDLSGNGMNGVYKGGAPTSVSLPNGDKASDFNGEDEYLTVASNAKLSIPTARELTWEGWVRPDTADFSKKSSDGYVDWMGKCANYSPNCEWEARIYSADTLEDRPNRFSAYVFNPTAGLGSAADWQPASNVIKTGEWVHVVAEYQTMTTPSGCSTSAPGSINIWVNGVKQDFASHVPTGCMSQFNTKPKAGDSPLNIGTMAMDTWFKGAVGKVAVYDRLLSQTEINEHFKAMTGKTPSGSCSEFCSIPML
jgi:hypothetical protein